jgi:integron integrase
MRSAQSLDLPGIQENTVWMNSHNISCKVRSLAPRPPLQATRILGQLRERLRYLHYSIRTEQSYVYWARYCIRFHGLRHPREMGQPQVEAFLSMLANERRVSVSTHRQALSALLFLYKEVLDQDVPWLTEIGRPTPRKRIPAVLTTVEVGRILGFLEGELGLLAKLLYGTGMRLMEAVRLRTKDVDFARSLIIVREAKGGKDRVVMLPHSLQDPLRDQLRRSRLLWDADRASQRAGVCVPDALAVKYPRAAQSWAWHWVFPSAASQLRYAPVAGGHRHPHRAGATGSQRRQYHDDLHARDQGFRWRDAEPAGRARSLAPRRPCQGLRLVSEAPARCLASIPLHRMNGTALLQPCDVIARQNQWAGDEVSGVGQLAAP